MSDGTRSVSIDTEVSEIQSTIDPETGWNLLLLNHIAESIQVAHETNPNSWALLRIKSLNLVLVVEQIAVMTLRNDGGDISLKGHPGDIKYQSLASLNIRTPYKYTNGFQIIGLGTGVFLEVAEKFRNDHHELIQNLAASVQTKSHRANEHKQEIVDHISSLVGKTLPPPEYMQSSPSNNENTRRFWKISPGRAAAQWSEFVDRGIIAMHWTDEPLDLNAAPAQEQEFLKYVQEHTEVSHAGSRHLWLFAREATIGDKVLAYGNRTVLGWGIVTGGYFSAVDEFNFTHRRSVTWESLDTVSVGDFPQELQSKLSRQATMFGLTEQEFDIATGRSNSAPIDLNMLSTVHNEFASKGLTYSRAQIATFYTALQTKGFVVLSGISGTGKSKIAQHFVEMLSQPNGALIKPVPDPDLVVMREVQPYMVKHHTIVIPVSKRHMLPAIVPGSTIYVTTTLGGETGQARIINEIMPQGNLQMSLFFRESLRQASKRLTVGDTLFIVPVLHDSGESLDRIEIFAGEDELPDKYKLHAESSKGSNNLFLAVRPDWRDSTSLLGYYNPLTETYEWTDFLRFILQAADSFEAKDGLAWFVILDEMNLAHVEYYFADLLSIIESGRKADGFSHDPIRLTYPDSLVDNAPPREVYLPPNLYIIGTVNMDETTHAFSPKVLDRAFTIELTEVDFSDYPPSTTSSGAELSEGEKRQMLDAFTRQGTFAQVSKAEVAAAVDHHPQLRSWLSSLNTGLEQDRFHFGYRVFDEIAQFVFNADENEMFNTWEEAFDHAVFMKVLPKFNGSRARLHGPLTTLAAWAINPEGPNPVVFAAAFQSQLTASVPNINTWAAGALLPRVAKRAIQMLTALEEDGFVSFG